MNPLLWLAGAVIVAVILLSIPFIQNFFTKPPEQPRDQEPELVVGGARRRRLRVNNVDNDIDEATAYDEDDDKQMKKIGTKKMIKLQAKAEKKALREQEEAFREDVKKREALRREELKKQEEEEEEQKKKEEQEEIEKRSQLEREEQEQYLKLKASFVVEEEGYMREEDESKSIQDFIQYIKENKVVFLEDLAAEFNMRTQDVIARVQSLQESHQLTGVIDDRGKFIYISVQELEGVAKFIRQRGRVSLSELAQSSNTLINLQPTAL